MPKGYWINHVEEIIDQEAFERYVTKVNALIERGYRSCRENSNRRKKYAIRSSSRV